MEAPQNISGIRKIERVGKYLEVDQNGFIVKEAREDKIQEKWKPAIAETMEAYKEHFGDSLISVYVRGSVARGMAMDGISDLDTRAIVALPKDQIDLGWAKEFNRRLTEKYPFVKEVEITACPKNKALDQDGRIGAILKIQAVCVYGQDILTQIPKIKLGVEAASHSRNLVQELEKSIKFLKQLDTENKLKIKHKCSWIMKRVLRTGFELVMEREQKYTRDLYLCYESFAKYYGDKKDDMYKVLELAINPGDDPNKIIPILEDWIHFMKSEIAKVFQT